MNDRHPRILWILSCSQIFYCLTLGSINALLTLYLITQLAIPVTRAYDIFAAMSAMLFTLPLLGGYLGEKYDYRLIISLGFIVAFIGILILSIKNQTCMYYGVSFFMVGNSFITPNVNAMVGTEYGKQSKLRNSGYTIYYLMSNIGFFTSALFSGFIASYNYSLAFLIGSVSMLLALLIFLIYTQTLQKIKLNVSFLQLFAWSALLIFAVSFLIRDVFLDNYLLIFLIVATVIGLLFMAIRSPSLQGKVRILLFLWLCIISVGFWSLYILEPSLLTVYISESVNNKIFGIAVPASSYYALDPFFIIVFGVLLSQLWYQLEKRKKDIEITTKFSLSIIFMGIAYLIFCASTVHVSSTTHLVSSTWVLFAYIFLTIAELLIVPIGLAMVGLLFPSGKESLGMGIWQIFIGFSAIISEHLANLTSAPVNETTQEINKIFFSLFYKIGFTAVIAGVCLMLIFFFLNPYLRKMITTPA